MASSTPQAHGSPLTGLPGVTTTPCQSCPKVEVVRKNEQATSFSATNFRSQKFTADVTFIFVKGDEVRNCAECRAHFKENFRIPDSWWTTWCRRSNGYFGAEDSVDVYGNMTDTWFRFIIKRFLEPDVEEGGKDYVWYKFNIFIHWDAETKSTRVLVFDPRPEVKGLIIGCPKKDVTETWKRTQPKPAKGLKPKPLIDRITDTSFSNPYILHGLFLEEIVYQQDEAVWGIRDRLRDVETLREKQKKRAQKNEITKPDYDRIHDVARHAIHVSETLDVAIATIEFIKSEHDQFLEYQAASNVTAQPAPTQQDKLLRLLPGKKVRKSIAFSENKLRSLRLRSLSNMDRLKNEIQLAFNTVAQYDAGVSIDIGRAARGDSEAMRTIAFLTLTFLPATFISSLFSMSFFNFDPESNQWRMSKQFWIYWAVTIPITAITAISWAVFWKLKPPPRVEAAPPKLGTAELAKEEFLKFFERGTKRADTEMSVA